MRNGTHINPRRLTIMVIVFAVVVIVGSLLLTRKPSKKEKNLEVSEPKSANSGEVQETSKEEDGLESSLAQMQNQISSQETTVTNTTTTNITTKTDTKKTNTTAKGRLPVANPDAVKLCKQAQTAHVKDIYLTFDDGPSPNVTPQILSILKEYDVPATFFVLGSRAELYPELIRQEYEAGHYIANHGYTHNYSAIYTSVQTVIDEYNSTEKAVQEALGNSDYHTLLFRFPGGSSGGPYDRLKGQAKSTLEEMGIASTNWNCLNGDAEGGTKTKQQLLNRLYQTAEGWESLVVLMHDANDKQTTADALPEIIEHYQALGYTFKNYYEIFQ